MNHILELFLEMLAVEKHHSHNTLLAYQRDLTGFFVFLKHKDYKNITTQDIASYLESLAQQNISLSTRSRKISALRHFFKFAHKERYCEVNPTLNLRKPKLGRPLPKVVTEDQVDQLICAASEFKGAEGLRLYAMLELLYATGLRVTELVSLPKTAIETIHNYPVIRVMGKGKKERIIPLHQACLQALQQYLLVRNTFGDKGSPYLFPSRSRQGYITRQRFYQILKTLAKKCGIHPSQVSPHVIRHAFATHLLNRGADLVSLQTLLGHSDISTTEIYTHLLPEQLQELVRSCHPLSNHAKHKHAVIE